VNNMLKIILAAVIASFITLLMMYVMFIGITMIYHILDMIDNHYESQTKRN